MEPGSVSGEVVRRVDGLMVYGKIPRDQIRVTSGISSICLGFAEG